MAKEFRYGGSKQEKEYTWKNLLIVFSVLLFIIVTATLIVTYSKESETLHLEYRGVIDGYPYVVDNTTRQYYLMVLSAYDLNQSDIEKGQILEMEITYHHALSHNLKGTFLDYNLGTDLVPLEVGLVPREVYEDLSVK